MVDEFDNRIRLPAPRIDFDDDVGITGQDHDEFPAPRTQARYDWMRLYLIGLLSHQSGEDIPIERRTGTTWMQRISDSIKFKFFNGTSFVDIANAIVVEDTGDSADDTLTLAEWFVLAQSKLNSIQPKATWSGSSIADGVTKITIPTSIQDLIKDISTLIRPLVYIEGVLVDPRNCAFGPGECPSTVDLSGGVEVNDGERFTVITERFDEFVDDEVVIE